MKNKVKVICIAPYAACLTTGAELSPGQVADVELDEYTESQIRASILAIIETPEPPKSNPPRKTQASTDAPATPTEGEPV